MIETFQMKDGKIITKRKPRFVSTGHSGNFESKFAKKEIGSMLNQMKFEIESSEKSSSVLIKKENSYEVSHRSFTASTFPKFMREAGINSKKDFSKVLASKKGKRFNRLKVEAIDRLNNGFQNQHGFDDPSTEFKVKTGQVHDNKDVIFRRIRGRIVPMRIKKSNRHDLMEDAPF